MKTKYFFFQFENSINILVLSASFEYLPYVMGVRSLYIFNSFSVGIDIRRQNLTSKVGPRAKRVNWFTSCSLQKQTVP